MRAALVLAAGASRRFGRRDKLRAVLMGRTLLAQAVARARETGAPRVLVVVPRRYAEPVSASTPLHRLPSRLPLGGSRNKSGVTRTVVARDAGLGIGASLAAGLAALRPIEREVLIFLADMPLAAAPRDLRMRTGADAVRPVWRGRPGHPLLVRTAVARRLIARNDRGLIVGLLRNRVALVHGRAGNVLDIDTPAALARVRRRIVGGQGRVPVS